MSVPKLRFKEFSGDWEEKTLQELADVKGGKRIPKGYSLQDESNGLPYITVTNMFRGGVDSNQIRYVPTEIAESIKNYKITTNDIFISVAGTLGIVGIVPKELNNANLTENANKLTNLKCHQHYLLQYLLSDRLVNLIDNVQTVGAQPKLAIYALNSLEVSTPALPEQTKIANFLTAVDEKIALLTQKADLLSQYKKGVMQQIFSQELRFKDDGGQEFPEWEDMPADKIFISVSNKNHNGDLPILAATQDKGMIYREDSGLDIKSTEASIKSYKIVEKGDFVISLRSFQGGIEYSSLMGICSPAYTVMKAKIELNNGFFKAFLKKEDFIEKLNGLVIGIRDGKQISYSAFATLTLPYPNIKEQTKIANFLTAVEEKITNNKTQLDAVKQYKQGLLQQMFV